jgi:hypothetical protein
VYLGFNWERVHLRKIFTWFRQRAWIFYIDFCRHLRDTARRAAQVGTAIVAKITANVVLCSHEESNVVQHIHDNKEANEVYPIEYVPYRRESLGTSKIPRNPVEEERREEHHSGAAEASTARVTF